MEWPDIVKSLQEFPYDPPPKGVRGWTPGWDFGMAGRKHTEETKKLIGEANTKYHTPEEREQAKKEQRKQWDLDHPEYRPQYKKKWDEKNKQHKKEYAKLYYERNKEEFARRSREQWERNNR